MRSLLVAAMLGGCFSLDDPAAPVDAPDARSTMPDAADSPPMPTDPATSCLDVLRRGESTGDGEYTIQPDDAQPAFTVWCDMTTDGGGWTFWTREGLRSYWNFDGPGLAQAAIGGDAGSLEGTASISSTVLWPAFGSSVSFGNDESSRLTMTSGIVVAAASTFLFFSHHQDCSNNEIPLHFADNSWMGDLIAPAGRVVLNALPLPVMDTTMPANCSVTVGTWIHHAYVDDGARMRYFRDGVEIVPEIYNYATLAGLNLNRFGSRPGFVTNGMTGELDEVVIFERALTDDEIQRIHQQARAGRPFRWRE